MRRPDQFYQLAKSPAIGIRLAALITMPLSLLTARILVQAGGTPYLGRWAIAQSLSGFVAITCDLNVGQGAIRRMRTSPDLRSATQRATWQITGGGIGLVLALGVLLSPAIGQWLWHLNFAAPYAVAAAAAGCTSMIATQVRNIDSGWEREERVAVTSVRRSVMQPTAAILCLWLFRLGPELALFVSTAAGLLVTLRRKQPMLTHVDSGAVAVERRELLAFGWRMTISSVVSTGVAVLVPVVLGARSGSSSAGEWRLSSNFSAAVFLLATSSFANGYFPSVCSSINDLGLQRQVVRSEARRLTWIFVVMALPMCLLAAPMLSLTYGISGGAGASLLPVLIGGEVLRATSWLSSYAVLAVRGPLVAALCEAPAVVAIVMGSWLVLGPNRLMPFALLLAASQLLVLAVSALALPSPMRATINRAGILPILVGVLCAAIGIVQSF